MVAVQIYLPGSSKGTKVSDYFGRAGKCALWQEQIPESSEGRLQEAHESVLK